MCHALKRPINYMKISLFTAYFSAQNVQISPINMKSLHVNYSKHTAGKIKVHVFYVVHFRFLQMLRKSSKHINLNYRIIEIIRKCKYNCDTRL